MTQTGDYRIETELNYGTPRKTHYTKPVRILRFGLIGAFLFLLALMLLLASADMRELNLLKAGGKRVTGRVTNKFSTTHRGGETYYLEYAFKARDTVWKGQGSVTRDVWERMDTGSRVSLVYLPSDPRVRRIGLSITDEMVQDKTRFWTILTGSMLLLFGGILGVLESDLRKQARLLRDGLALPAEIVSMKAVNPRMENSMYRLTYRFMAPSGEQITRRMKIGPVTAGRLAGQHSFTVLCDPRRPANHRPYFSLQAVESVS